MLFVILFGLGVRLVFLQVFLHDRYRKIADSNTQSLSVREPRRGDILDVNGNPIAVSVPVKRVIANPVSMGRHYVGLQTQKKQIRLSTWSVHGDQVVTLPLPKLR